MRMEKMTRRRLLMLGGVAALGLGATYAVFIERYLIRENTYRVAVPNLPAAFAGLRIVHLTDFHYGRLMPASMLERIVARANLIPRDLTLCTGDTVNGNDTTAQIDTVWSILAKLDAPRGVYSVLGNHDHWANTERSQYWLERTGQDLRHKTVAIEKDGQRLWLAGAGDLWEDHRSLDGLLRDVPPTECRIVLAHNPDSADSGFASRVDLMISGHTHGGQVVIPFWGPPVLPVANKNYSSGLKLSKRGTKVFISRGLGWAILPVRFNCTPEIAILELQAEI